MKKSSILWRIYMASNWWLWIGIFLVCSGILWPVGAVFIFIWTISFINKKMNEKKQEKRYIEERGLSNEPEIYNNYFEGDKVVNIRSKDEFHRIIDWK